jgi:hypothetical protein
MSMKYLYYYLIGFLIFVTFDAAAQSFYFGPKAGLAINTQQWNNFERDALFSLHGDLFIESYSEGSTSSLYAQVGYHTRGSAVRLQGFNIPSFSNAFKFNNIVLIAAAKRLVSDKKNIKPYYVLGIRGEYTVSNNLDEYTQFQSIFYPLDFYVNKFNYGFVVGGGFDFELSDLYGAFIEFVVSPDISFQYQQPAIPNVISPFNGQTVTISERRIRNLSLEITFGMRFLRKVEYY